MNGLIVVVCSGNNSMILEDILTLIGGGVQENPFFTPPAEMLKELKARKTPVAA